VRNNEGGFIASEYILAEIHQVVGPWAMRISRNMADALLK
jgi:hypothetical protein